MTAPPRPTARRPSNQRRSTLECVAIARQRPSRHSSSVPCSPAAYSRSSGAEQREGALGLALLRGDGRGDRAGVRPA